MTNINLDGEESLIKYPAALSVKAMGLNSDDFEQCVLNLVQPLIAPANPSKVVTSLSSQGKYMSVRVHFIAVSQSQLESIYVALRNEPRVKFTL